MGQAPWLDDLKQKSVSLRPGTWAVYRNTANPKFVIAPVISDSPAVSVTEISDPASADAGLELIELDAVQLESQPLRARSVLVRLGAASVLFHASNRRLRTSTSVQEKGSDPEVSPQIAPCAAPPRSRASWSFATH